MKKAIIVASYGCINDAARKNSIDKIEDMFRDHFTDVKVVGAYSSERIRFLLGKDGIDVPSPVRAMEDLHDDGFDFILIYPLLLFPGSEFTKLQIAVNEARNNFEHTNVFLGDVIFYNEEAMRTILDMLQYEYPIQNPQEVNVFIGHGSDKDIKGYYKSLKKIAASKNYPIIFGTLKDGVDEVKEQLSSLKINKVRLIPLMLAAGRHVNKDILNTEKSWLTDLSEAGYEVKGIYSGIGDIIEIQKYFVEKCSEKIQNLE